MSSLGVLYLSKRLNSYIFEGIPTPTCYLAQCEPGVTKINEVSLSLLTGLTKQEVLKLRGDLSPYLIHLTRGGWCKLKADAHPSLPKDETLILKARDSLIDIISQKVILARGAFSYFNRKVPLFWNGRQTSNLGSYVQRSWLLSVCFTETPVDHVHVQCRKIIGRQLPFEPYGLAFFEESVRPRGNPLFYFDTDNQSVRDAMDALATNPLCSNFQTFLPLVETFGRPTHSHLVAAKEIDFKWEREWRVPENFDFTFADVAFGLCKEIDIPFFENLVGDAFPFIDPMQSMEAVKTKLRLWPKLANLK
jgi:hypothetical protein